MRRFPLFRWVAAVILAIVLAPGAASAQEDDTLSISGIFGADGLMYAGIIGDDLGEVLANGYEHGWTLTLHGVSYSYDYQYAEWDDAWGYGHSELVITRVHATSFDFQFVGPDADVLNSVVSEQLASGSLPEGAFLELSNGDYFDSSFTEDNGSYSSFDVGLQPLDFAAGVSFHVSGIWYYGALLSTDEYGFPVVQPQRVEAYFSTIYDYRPGNGGGLFSYYDPVDIGSDEPPVLPLALRIADGSVLEGNKGASRLDLTVRLSGSSDDVVTVNYATVNGTAVGGNDYIAASGTLTFQPGQTSRTISIAIKGDRKREPNETFSVQLFNASGAVIDDAVGTVTILNDD